MSEKPAPGKTVKCPTCGKPAPWSEDNTWRPFCSERCKLIDLGEWASEGYSIKGEAAPRADDRDEFNH